VIKYVEIKSTNIEGLLKNQRDLGKSQGDTTLEMKNVPLKCTNPRTIKGQPDTVGERCI
jgi:hypothetical protein